MYTQRVGGTWNTPVTLYDYQTNPPAGDNTSTGVNVQTINAVPNSGTGGGIAAVATLGYQFTQSVWFLALQLCPGTSAGVRY